MRRTAAILVPVVYAALQVGIYCSVRSCDDSWFVVMQLGIFASAALALAGALLARFEPKWLWIIVVVASPLLGFVFAFFIGLQGEFDGSCGRY